MSSTPGHDAMPGGDDRRHQPSAEADRRQSGRRCYEGIITIIWHHRPGHVMSLETVDINETGARVRTTCCLPDGMTGMAVELHGMRRSVESNGESAACIRSRPERLPIGRAVTVVWSIAIRRDDGRLDHYEAGLRFF